MNPRAVLISYCMSYGKLVKETAKVLKYITRNGIRVTISKRR